VIVSGSGGIDPRLPVFASGKVPAATLAIDGSAVSWERRSHREVRYGEP